MDPQRCVPGNTTPWHLCSGAESSALCGTEQIH